MIKLFLFLLTIVCVFAAAKAQTPKPIYDNRKDFPAAKIFAADEKLLKTEILPKARAFWKNTAGCQENFRIVGVARGSFTTPATAQKAFLYNFCETGHNFDNNGIVIIENGKPVAHYVYEGGAENSIIALPDINDDGLNELLITAGGTNQGITWETMTIVELSPKGVKKFGNTQTYEDNCGVLEKGCYERTYKISVKFGAKPIFYHQEYLKIRKIWTPSGKQVILKMQPDIIKYKSLE